MVITKCYEYSIRFKGRHSTALKARIKQVSSFANYHSRQEIHLSQAVSAGKLRASCKTALWSQNHRLTAGT
jgi:hypothetical protein